MAEELLRMRGICKSFSGVPVLKGVELACNRGEVLVLAGENGAGKSTLLKILTGLYQADSGEILYNGKPVRFKSPEQSAAMGIAMVYQELTLIQELNVLDNIFLNRELKTRWGRVDYPAMQGRLKEVMERYHIFMDTQAMVKELPVAQQQMVEILKILVRDPELIILDEPTSALAKQEAGQLFEVIRSLVENRKSVIFISHRMEENFTVGDRVTVLKDGSLAGTAAINEVTQDDLIRMMVGRELRNVFPAAAGRVSDETVFEIEGLSGGMLRHISLAVRHGEILGIAGLQGHGQSELLQAVSGLYPVTEGRVRVHGQQVDVRGCGQAIRQGIALVPADRKRQGLNLSQPIRQNMALGSLNLRKKLGLFIDRKQETSFVADMTAKLSIRAASMRTEVCNLSGGNQQKVVLGKELGIVPKVILFDEPTRGIDVEAKTEFYHLIRAQADAGVATVVNSSDMMEVIGLCDRVAVMYEGAVTAVLEKHELSEETVMRCAMGRGRGEGA